MWLGCGLVFRYAGQWSGHVGLSMCVCAERTSVPSGYGSVMVQAHLSVCDLTAAAECLCACVQLCVSWLESCVAPDTSAESGSNYVPRVSEFSFGTWGMPVHINSL